MKVDLRSVVDEIKQRIKVNDWIASQPIEIRRGGGINDKVKCPFCNSNSFGHARAKEHTFTCYNIACRFHQQPLDIIAFVSYYKYDSPPEGETFIKVVKELAQEAGIPLPADTADYEPSPKERQNRILADALTFYHEELRKHPAALEYLKCRGVTAEQIEKYRIGYARGGRTLLRYLQTKGYTKDEIISAGLVTQKGYDLLWDMVVVDVHSARGGTIYGRNIKPDAPKENRHRYLIGRPQNGLFGLPHHAKTLLLSEAIFDSLAQENAIEFVVANIRAAGKKLNGQGGIDWSSIASTAIYGTCGFRPEYIDDLKRIGVEEVILTLDGDEPGLIAAKKYAAILEPHFRVRIAVFPEGEDPNSIIVKKGAIEWLKCILASISPVELEIELILRRCGKSATDRVLAAEEIAKVLMKRNAVVQHIMAEKVSKTLGVPLSAVLRMIEAAKVSSAVKTA